MKRLRSSDDLDSYEKITSKEANQNRSSSHRSSSSSGFYHKPSSDSNSRTKSNLISSSSSRHDRDRSVADEDSGRERDRERLVRKRSEHDFESFDRRKLGFDRYRESGGSSNSLHRSESFCGPRREFPKGFRSERDRTRRESGSGSSWRRFGIDENRGSSKLQIRDVRDVKSPTLSRDSLGAARVVGESREREDLKRRSSKSKSPTLSRDSGSEQSKSFGGGGGEAKKSEETIMESETSSEMEEGEFDPEPEGGALNDRKECSHRETENDEGEMNPNAEVVEEADKEMGNERKGEEKEDDELQNSGKSLNGGSSSRGDKVDDGNGDEVGKEEEGVKFCGECEGDSSKDAVVQKSYHLEENCKEDKGIDLEMQVEECEVAESNKEVAAETGELKINMDVAEIGLSQNVKDKGKDVAVESTNVTDSAENGVWIERESKDADHDTEGPSTRGFELFSCSPVRRVEKVEQSGFDNEKDEKLALESLDLSLSLPNVLLPIGAQDTDAVPGSPSHGRSVQSLTNTFRTNSDGFTASMSFSGSQSFYHNPSCSLTQHSVDNYEQSVHSRPIFQGVDQLSQGAGQSHDESRHKDIPMFQRILMNGNGSFSQSSALQGIKNSQAVRTQNIRILEGSSKIPNGIERQLSFHKQNDVRSPSQSVGSHEIGSNCSFEKKRAMREKQGGSLYRSGSQKEQGQLLIGGANFVETIISRMVSEPIHVMARKFHEMTGQPIACLKESIREIMLNADKYGQLRVSQGALLSHSDLTMETLLKSHRAQLEILVALKTGLPEYLQVDNSVSSSDLAEIFLNLRCRNLMCRSSVPVDECDCKVCSKKNGFCSSCMCLVCSKFDMASNTCSWVGCDVCLHWCHADCGLRESYIRNGHNAAGMQFHCVACDHPSEMFGFVKEVFLNFSKEWTLQTFSKELEYVKRIFSGSKDVRGKRLHEIASQMLVRLAKKPDLPEVYSKIMSFLSDSDSSKPDNTTVLSGKEQGKGVYGIAGPNQDTTWLKSFYSDKASQLESSSSLLPSFHADRSEQSGKRPIESELKRSAQKQSFLPELESFIRVKQEEAKMYQTRADDARREAEGLKRIAIMKNEKIEEEYMSRVTKLRLVEAEEMRKQKLEEFQALDRAYREYYGMKRRMEADIKDLLLKMEATRRNLAIFCTFPYPILTRICRVEACNILSRFNLPIYC
ncbi:hypothetical protein DITRI_Ditri11bG0180600 [Diplodiscus trichospermus]